MAQISQPGDELGGGVPLPASRHIIFLYDGFTASFNTPEGEHRHPTLLQCVEIAPRMSSSRRAAYATVAYAAPPSGFHDSVVFG